MLFIFDMGGVILKDVFVLGKILDAHHIKLDMLELYKDDIMDKLSSGEIYEEEYWKRFNLRYDTNIESPQFARYFNPDIDLNVVNLIKKLKVNHRVVCGSNSIDSHYDFSTNRGDYNCFDKVYASHILGVSKPNKKFWEIILQEENYNPSNVIFIDDFSENIEAATLMGINCILYENIESLENSIKEIVN